MAAQSMWPEWVQCPVVLSFDVDAELLWKFWRTDEVSIFDASQGMYGPNVGLPRILAMLKRHNIKATFFTPGWVAEKYPKVMRKVADEGHEIGHYGYLHEDCSKLSYQEERDMMIKGSDVLQKVTGKRPKGFRLIPGKNTLSLLSELGLLYDSVMMDADRPYRVILNGKAGDLIELPVCFAFNDTSYMAYGFGIAKPFLAPRDVEGIYRDEFDTLYSEGNYCMFMLHRR